MEQAPDLSAMTEAARAGAVVETLHGVDIADPFRGLEDDSDETWAWVDAQNSVTDAYMAEHAADARTARLEARTPGRGRCA